jgi:hypothetical protein
LLEDFRDTYLNLTLKVCIQKINFTKSKIKVFVVASVTLPSFLCDVFRMSLSDGIIRTRFCDICFILQRQFL